MRRLLQGLLLLTALSVAMPVWARDYTLTSIRTRMEDLNVQMAEMETHDFADEAAGELAQCRLEVGEIQGMLARNEVGEAAIVLQRLEARMFLIQSLLERATFEDLATERETELFEIQSVADQLQIDLTSTEQRRRQMQEQVQTIVDSMGGTP
jgi:hypothetical protein